MHVNGQNHAPVVLLPKDQRVYTYRYYLTSLLHEQRGKYMQYGEIYFLNTKPANLPSALVLTLIY